MPLSDDPLNNASPKTRQRFENARARRRSRESRFQVVIPSSVMQHIEARAQQAQGNDSQAWVQWEYSPKEWARFDQIDWMPRRRACFWLLMGLLPFGFGLGLFAVSGSSVAGVLAIAIVALGILFFFWISHGTEAAQRHKARQKSVPPHRITISAQGMWEAGVYFPLTNLARVKMTSQPPVLHFHSIMLYTSSTEAADTVASYRRRVLVPSGHEEEAERLVQRFRTEVIEAQEQASQRVMKPPEPV